MTQTLPAAKAGPPTAETDAATGSRWYIHPRTGERFISVTTVLGNISKFGIPAWAARLSATAAFDRLPQLVRAARTQPCNLTKTDDACGICRDCVTYWLADRHNQARDEAAERGIKLHDLAEQDTLFGDGAHVDADVAPYWELYCRWRDAYKPQFHAAEMTVISRKWGYAGTLDSILSIEQMPEKLAHLAGLPVCTDLKTTNAVDIVKGWQVVAYANADAVLLPDGEEVPMPEIKGGLILHIFRDKKTEEMRAQMREVYLTDANLQSFIHMLRVVEGLGAGLNTVLSRPINLPKES